MNNYLHSRTISRKFYDLIREKYPRATKEELGLAFYEMFTANRTNEGKGNAIIDYLTLARIFGQEKQALSRNFKAKAVLKKFNKTVEPFWEQIYDYVSGTARTMQVEWPKEIQQAIVSELEQAWKWSGRVYLDGSPFNHEEQLDYFEQQRKLALKTLVDARSKESRELVRYFNSLPPGLYTDTLKYHDQAIEVAKNLPNKSHHLRVLAAIFDCPKPLLKTVTGSSRAYQTTESLITVKSEIRKVLTQDWLDADLKSCQLGIAAHIWQVPEVQEFLIGGNSIWEYLTEQLQIELTPGVKKQLKAALYAMLYGARQPTIRGEMCYLGKDAFEKFMETPLIQALWKAKKKQIALARKKGGIYDAFGNWLTQKEAKKEKHWQRSILAQVNQSYELKLLYPAIRLAIKHKHDLDGFYLPIYQFDGFCLLAKKPEMTEYWKVEVAKSVNKQAESMGLAVRLEFGH